MTKQDVSNYKDLYELVERVRTEINSNVTNSMSAITNNQGRLEHKFDQLEAGRLTTAEGEINKLKVAAATINVKLAILVFIATAVVSTTISIVVGKVVK